MKENSSENIVFQKVRRSHQSMRRITKFLDEHVVDTNMGINTTGERTQYIYFRHVRCRFNAIVDWWMCSYKKIAMLLYFAVWSIVWHRNLYESGNVNYEILWCIGLSSEYYSQATTVMFQSFVLPASIFWEFIFFLNGYELL